MKRILSVFSFALCAIAMMAQEPVITFTTSEHDFGKINEADGRVTTVFEFKNEGMTPLVLSNVRASCGCTTPKWTREPIEPGQSGQITVTYNPNGRPGRFQKTITVTSNATEPTKKLFIKGEVIPKPAKPINQYPVQMGELSIKAKTINLGTIKKNGKTNYELEYANHTDHVLNVDLATRSEDNFLISQTTLNTLNPNQTGKFIFAFDANVCKLYGPVEVAAYVVVGDKQVISDEYKLTIKADITEDFSTLSVEQRQQAPIVNTAATIDFGKVVAGKKIKKSLSVINEGTNALIVRRIYSANNNIIATAPKAAIKSGKKADAKIELNTIGLTPGAYTREITVITNDPNQPRKTVKITWTVE